MASTNASTTEVHRPRGDTFELLSGQTALVTGASSGIGTGIALALADSGADVVVNYIGDEEGAREVAEGIEARGRQALILEADISDEEAVRSLFQRTTERFGGLDILINNAGIQRDAPFDEMTLDQWNAVIGVDLTGHFLCAREAVRLFKRRGVDPDISCAAGKILFITSVHDRIPWAGRANYAAAKAGAQMLMKTIAQETAEYRIRANAIAPGAIKTPINEDAWKDEESRRKLLELIPYKRIGEIEDIGRAAAWMVSDQTDYITGSTLVVDGGMTLFPGFITGG